MYYICSLLVRRMKKKLYIIFIYILFSTISTIYAQTSANWNLVWREDFGIAEDTVLKDFPDPSMRVEGHKFAGRCTSVNDGYYAIANSTKWAVQRWKECNVNDNWFASARDHTGNDKGCMLIVNVGSAGKGEEIYRQDINFKLCSERRYKFTIFAASITGFRPESLADLTMQIVNKTTGDVIAQKKTDTIALWAGTDIYGNWTDSPFAEREWQEYSVEFTANDGDEISLLVLNHSPSGSGNDFVIDDISLYRADQYKIPEGLISTNVISSESTQYAGTCTYSAGFTVPADAVSTWKMLYSVPYYVWQKSTDDGLTWTTMTEYSGANKSSILMGNLDISVPEVYRVVTSGGLTESEAKTRTEYIAEHGGPAPADACAYYSVSNILAGVPPEPDCSYKENLKTIWKEDFGVIDNSLFRENPVVSLNPYTTKGNEFKGNDYVISSDPYTAVGSQKNPTCYYDCDQRKLSDYGVPLSNDAVLYTRLLSGKESVVLEKVLTGPFCNCKNYIFSFKTLTMSSWTDMKYTVEIKDASNSLLLSEDISLGGTDSPRWKSFQYPFSLPFGYTGKITIQLKYKGNQNWNVPVAFDDFRVSVCQETVPQATLYLDDSKNTRYIGGFDCEVTPPHIANLTDIDEWISDYPNYGYVWQMSRDGVSWTTIPENNQAHYCEDLEDGETFYRVVLGETKAVAQQVAANGKPTDPCSVFFITNSVGLNCKGVTCDKPAMVEIISSDTDKVLCPDGSTTLSISEKSTVTGTFDYLWFKDAIGDDGDAVELGNDNASTTSVAYGEEGKYILLVRDATQPTLEKCWQTAEILITAKGNPSVTLSGSDEYCFGETVSPATFSFEGNGSFTFSYSDGTTTYSDVVCSTDTYNPATPSTISTSVYTISELSDEYCSISNPTGTVTIKIKPVPSAVASNNGPKCEDLSETITLSGSSDQALATYEWTGPNSFSSKIANPVLSSISPEMSGEYSLTVSLDGCSSTETTDVEVYEGSTISLFSSDGFLDPVNLVSCSGDELKFTVSFDGGNPGVATWTIDGKKQTQNLTSGKTEITFKKDVTSAETIDLLLEYENAAGCKSSRTISKTFTINPIPSAPIVTNLSICEGASSSALTATAAGTLSWFNTADNDEEPLSAAPVPNTSSIGETDYYVSQIVDGCESERAKIVVNVSSLPKPVISVSKNEICYDVDAISLSLDKTYNSQTWTCTPSNVLSSLSSSSPTIAKTTTPDTYSIGVTVTDGNGCSATAKKTETITIHPKPTVSIAVDDTQICNLTSTGLTAMVSEPDGFGEWTNADKTAGSETSATFTATSTGLEKIQYVYTSKFDCKSNIAEKSILVNPIPQAPTTRNLKYCKDATDVTELTATATGTLTWFDADKVELSGTPTPSTAVATTITYYVKQTDQGCSSDFSQLDVVVNPLPEPVISADNTTVCKGTPISLGLNGVTYKSQQWSYSPSTSNVLSSITDAAPTLLGTVAADTYTIGVVVVDANNCSNSTAVTKEILVNPIPTATISIDSKVCVDGEKKTATVVSVTPEGGIGTFSVDGTGKIDAVTGEFDPKASGTGTYTISYDYTSPLSNGGCTSAIPATTTIRVLDKPTVSVYPTVTGRNYACESGTNNEDVLLTTNVNPIGGTVEYSCETTTIDETTGTLTPTSSNKGTHTIVATYTDLDGCVNQSSIDVTVYSLPEVSFSPTMQTEICFESAPITLDVSPTTSGTGLFSGAVTSSTFDPDAVGPGANQKITYTFTDNHGCTNSAQHFMTVIKVPKPSVDGGNSKMIIRGSDGELSSEPNLTAVVSTAGDGIIWEPGTARETTDMTFVTGLTNLSEAKSYEFTLVETHKLATETCVSDPTTATVVISDCQAKTPLVDDQDLCLDTKKLTKSLTIKATPQEGTVAAGNKISWFTENPVGKTDAGIADILDNNATLKYTDYDVSVPSVKTIYVAEYDGTEGCWSGGRPVVIRVWDVPVVKIIAPESVCSKDGVVPIALSHATGTLQCVTGSGLDVDKREWNPNYAGNPNPKVSVMMKYSLEEVHGKTTCKSQDTKTIVAHFMEKPIATDKTWLIGDVANIPADFMTAELSSTGKTITWYADILRTTVLNEDGTTSFTPVVSAEELEGKTAYVKSYWVTQTDEFGCESDPLEVKLNLVECPWIAPEVVPVVACQNDASIADLSAQITDESIATMATDGEITKWIWYDSYLSNPQELADNSQSSTFGHGITTDNASTSLFYVSYVAKVAMANDRECESPKTPVLVTVNPAPKIELSPSTICYGDSKVVDALINDTKSTLVSNGTWAWSIDGKTGGIDAHTGNIQSNFENDESDHTYTVTLSYTDVKNCTNEQSVDVFVEYVEKPTVENGGFAGLVTAPAATVSISVSDSDKETNAKFYWYDDETDLTDLYNSSDILFETGLNPAEKIEKSYWVSKKIGECESERSEAFVQIVDCPFGKPLVSGQTICSSSEMLQPLTASTIETTPTKWVWYDESGQKIADASDATYNHSVSNSEVKTTKFYVSYIAVEPISGEECESAKSDVAIEILPLPEISLENRSVCYDDGDITMMVSNIDYHRNGEGSGSWQMQNQPGIINATSGSLRSDFNSSVSKTEDYTIVYTYVDGKNCSNSESVTLTVQFVPEPTVTNHYSYSVDNEKVILDAINLETDASVKWYASLDDARVLSNNSQYITNDNGSVEISKEYFASQIVNGCESQRASAIVEIIPCPVPNVFVEVNDICVYDEAPEMTFTLGSWLNRNEKSVVNVYDENMVLLQIVDVANLLYTPMVNGAGKYVYFVEEYNSQPNNLIATGCASKSPTKVSFEVKEPIAPSLKVGDAVCYGDGVTPTMSGIGMGEILWFEENPEDYYTNKSIEPNGTGVVYNPFDLDAGTHTVWALLNEDGCYSKVVTAEYTIKPKPEAPGTEGCEACYNRTISDCAVSVTTDLSENSFVTWYADADKKGSKLSMSKSFKPYVQNPGTYTYYASQTVDGCESTTTPATILIKEIPLVPIVNNQPNRCTYDKPAVLKAEGENIVWYASDKITVLGNENTYETNDTVAANKIYYVTQTIDGCESPFEVVTYSINTKPINPIVIGGSICEGGTDIPSLSTNMSMDKWYADSDAKIYLSTGYNYTPDANAVGSSDLQFYVVREQRGCHSDTIPVTLRVILQPTFSIGDDTIMCVYDSSLTIQAREFVPPINEMSFVGWSVSDGKKSKAYVDNEAHAISPEIVPNSLGTYTVKAFYRYKYDNVSCNSDTISATYTIKKRARTPIVFANLICQGTEIKDLQALGSPNMTWTSLDGIAPQRMNGPIFRFQPGQVLDTGTYRFEVHDIEMYDEENGCLSLSDTVSLTVAPGALTKLFGADSVCVGVTESYYTQYTADSKYLWKVTGDNLTYSKDAMSSSVRYVDWTAAGIDTITVYEQTWAGCEGFDTLVVKVAPKPVADFVWMMPGLKNDVELTNASFQDSLWYDTIPEPITYSMYWNFGHHGESDIDIDTIIPYDRRNFPILETDYEYGYNCPILTVVNDFGCKDSYTECFYINITSSLYMPTAFSPSNPAYSVRTFAPKGFNLKSCQVWVFDKWGNLIWYSDEVEDGMFVGFWDGTYDGTMMQPDNYVWKMEAVFLDGKVWEGFDVGRGKKKKYGSVTLLR